MPFPLVCPHSSPSGIACANGSMPDPEQTTCVPCPAGTAGTGGRCDVECSYGQRPDAHRERCVPCEYGMFSDRESCGWCSIGWELNSDSSGCRPCSRGLVSDDGQSHGVLCERCRSGREPNRPEQMATDCSSCAAGRFSQSLQEWMDADVAIAGLSWPTWFCEACPAGRYSEQGASFCDFCPLGKNPNSEATLCDPCPAGRPPCHSHLTH